ncbi:hypothetical protein C8R45DRAFT_1215285 [Mycena sanguinolenta]|nr:hypothetical protein C8R45DRAFT_1215285 [Mycena sanguinolenta]
MPIKLTIQIQYTRSKAKCLVDENPEKMGRLLLADLDRFKLPHPPKASIQAPTHHGIEFYYTTKAQSPLFWAVMRTFDMLQLAGSRKYMMKNNAEIDALKTACFIEHMTLEETEVKWTSIRPPKAELRRAQSLSLPRRSSRRSPSPVPSVNNWLPRPREKSRRSPSPVPSVSSWRPSRRSSRRSPSPVTSVNSRRPPHRQSSRRSRSPVPSVDNWRGVDRKPLRRHNSSIARWAKNVPSKDKLKVDQNRVHPKADLPKTESPSKKTVVAVKNPSIARLTREYWNTRWELWNDAARGILVETQLSNFGAEVDDVNFTEQISQLEATLETERTKLHAIEMLFEDVLRECETPVLVPELLKLAEMCGGDECAMSEDE